MKWKARIVGNGGDLRDWWNQQTGANFEMYTLLVSVSACMPVPICAYPRARKRMSA